MKETHATQTILSERKQDPVHNTIDYEAILRTFEELSKAAHHYCDILHHLSHTRNDRHNEDPQGALMHIELVEIRTEIFEQVEATLSTTREIAKMIDASLLVDNDRQRHPLSQLALLLVGLLKRKAEAGNDLFLVVSSPEEKIRVAKTVLDTLDVSCIFIFLITSHS